METLGQGDHAAENLSAADISPARREFFCQPVGACLGDFSVRFAPDLNRGAFRSDRRVDEEL